MALTIYPHQFFGISSRVRQKSACIFFPGLQSSALYSLPSLWTKHSTVLLKRCVLPGGLTQRQCGRCTAAGGRKPPFLGALHPPIWHPCWQHTAHGVGPHTACGPVCPSPSPEEPVMHMAISQCQWTRSGCSTGAAPAAFFQLSGSGGAHNVLADFSFRIKVVFYLYLFLAFSSYKTKPCIWSAS